jgi:hypothetical protein
MLIRIALLTPLPFLLICLAGCSDNLHVRPVEGTVRLDGQPLAGAEVIFRPENGRPSLGVTDAQGRYILRYSADQLGALVGKHKVSISTSGEAAETGAEDAPAAQKVEKLPARYNSQSTLEVTVDASGAEIDFDLSSTPRD